MVIRAEVDGKEDEEEERQCLFGSNISVDTFYAILEYKPLSANNNIV